MNVQWYPGHMAKARRIMQEDLKLIDLIIELLDARAPQSSRNPEIDKMAQLKTRLVVLNKADLADEKKNQEWGELFRQRGFYVAMADSRSRGSLQSVHVMMQKACREKKNLDRLKGIQNRPIRAMVVGIPNVGKSTFINAFAGKACTKTGNRPGVTKGKQWIRLNKSVELLDTPGILWPKFDDPQVGERLAMIGSIKDEIVHIEELSLQLLAYLQEAYPGILKKRYQIEEDDKPLQLLGAIARRRGCLKKGADLDYEKAAFLLMEEFRSGKLGRITLE